MLEFPWEKGEKPYFVNEEGWEWYKDESTTAYAQKEILGGNSPLKAQCFIVRKGEVITRVLINDKQEILAEDSSIQGIGTKIDILRVQQGFKDEE